jgi:hypothetical protein
MINQKHLHERKKGYRRSALLTASILLLTAVVLLFTVSCSSYALIIEPEGSESTWKENLEVSDGYLILRPSAVDSSTGIIFYPGGLVEPEAYIPSAWEIAEASQAMVVIVSMPLDLAVLAPKRGLKIPEMFPEIEKWYIAGHSLGGAMAASLITEPPAVTDMDNVDDVKSRDYRNTDYYFSGLILMGAYPANSNSLNSSRVPVLSIYSEFDGLATMQKIDEKRFLLPPTTRYFYIAGGNHAQFGSYGPQKDDGVAAISPQEQWEIVGTAIADFINRTGGTSQ